MRKSYMTTSRKSQKARGSRLTGGREFKSHPAHQTFLFVKLVQKALAKSIFLLVLLVQKDYP
jgi:hypothetical protein